MNKIIAQAYYPVVIAIGLTCHFSRVFTAVPVYIGTLQARAATEISAEGVSSSYNQLYRSVRSISPSTNYSSEEI